MTYKPTAEDFTGLKKSSTYQPTARDFQSLNSFIDPNNKNQSAEYNEELTIPEETGLSGIFSDLLGNALAAKDFIEEVPSNIEKRQEYLKENPLSGQAHELGQLAASTAEMGKGLINAPYNLNQYLARKHLLPQVLGKLGKFIPHLPEDTGVEKALGLESKPETGDALIRAVPEAISMGTAATQLSKALTRKFKTPDLGKSIKETQAKVTAEDTKLGKSFDKIENEFEKRNIPPVKIDKQIIEDAKRFLDKSDETKALISKAMKGDYKALRDIQSDLRVVNQKGLESDLSSERNKAKEAGSVRNKLNNSITEHLENTGHKDLADLLEDTKAGYKNIQETYFSSPALARVFGKSQKVPKNPMTLLTEDSAEMNKFKAAHPEVVKALGKALSHKQKMKILKGIGAIVTAGATGGATYKGLNKF